jgi:hypothetical protein
MTMYADSKKKFGDSLHKNKLYLRRLGWRLRAFYRLTPFSRVFGFDFGKPLDRYYIEKFLSQNSAAIKGRVLEVGDSFYTRLFGAQRVKTADVLHAIEGNAEATLVGDLATGQGIPCGVYDCIILTQVLPFIYDVRGALKTSKGALNSTGTLLVTVPGISQISRYDMDRWGDYWRFTSLGLRRLLEEQFPEASITVQVYGNVLAASAFLYGLASEDLRADELDTHDSDYEVIIAAKVIKVEKA